MRGLGRSFSGEESIMRKLVRSLFGPKQTSSRASSRMSGRQEALPRQIRIPIVPPLAYVIGDIHGCLDLYRSLEDKIIEDAAGASALLILVGDLIDRGPDSAGVICHAMGPAPSGMERITLMGNHEQMMLSFLKSPRAQIRWLEYGGQTTLTSYGIGEAQMGNFSLPEAELSERIQAQIPAEQISWIKALPGAVRLGDRYFISHSGINAQKPLNAQSAGDLMWTRGFTGPPPPGVTVIHGHTPIETVDLSGRYIDIDTGVYASGRLSAVRLTPDEAPVLLEVCQEPT